MIPISRRRFAASLGAGLALAVALLVAGLIFRANADFAELYMPFDALLFFADAGNGDQFAYAIQAGAIRRPARRSPSAPAGCSPSSPPRCCAS